MSKDNTEDLQFRLALLAPQYWGIWFGFALLRVLILLPYPWMMRLGRGLGRLAGWLMQRINPKRCAVLQTNLQLCFPELATAERQQLSKRIWQSMGMTLLESAMAWWGSSRKIKRLCQIEGLACVRAAQQQGKGIVIISPHSSALDLNGRWCGQWLGAMTTAKPIHNRVAHYIISRARRRYLTQIFFANDYRATIKALRAGNIIGFMLDINFGRSDRRAVFAPFMGVLASTSTAFSKMAKRNDFAFIVLSTYRLPNGQGYQFNFKPAPAGFPSGDEYQDAMQFNALIEDSIRPCPEQYFWLHKRFKSRPEGEPALYR